MRVIRSKAGKTLELIVELEVDVIRRIEISGDFMAHPTEAIEGLERRLRGVRLGEHAEVIREALKDVELIGITVEDILNALGEMLRGQT
ncbi:MAG: lipoate protein ligase C-terminal domain-containing protein [Candidatus Korarchaeum sp.]